MILIWLGMTFEKCFDSARRESVCQISGSLWKVCNGLGPGNGLSAARMG